MPFTAPRPAASRPSVRELLRLLAAGVALSLVAVAAIVLSPAPASAAERGTGFGTWAPVSAYGWHGSMLVNGVHTYCILPGLPLPTGQSVDHGISGGAAGLSAEQLTRINHLVSTHGQTDDPVQAAAVGWAVKAVADWDETLGQFGYEGDALAGVIDRVFSRLAPEHSAAVQQRAVAFYDEAMRISTGAPAGSLVFTADPVDHRSGTVRVETSAAGAVGTVTLVDAVFTDTGAATREDVTTGTEYAITTAPPAPGRAYTVSGTGRFAGGVAPAVRHFTTAGGQDTAGPGGLATFDVAGADTSPRVPVFSPAITTQVASRYVAGGAFVDDVIVTVADGDWPRSDDGSPLPISASAEVFRTETEPAEPQPSVPAEAERVGSLALVTGDQGGDISYRVTSDWELPGPGFYTAVWTITRDAQQPEIAAHLPAGFSWTELFGVRSQITAVPDVSSRAEGRVLVGAPMSDTVVVGGVVPTGGLTVSSAVYRAVAGVEPEEACTPETLVWQSEPITVTEAGEYTVTSPAVTEPGTYYWRERAVDGAGEEMHHGPCGLANETTIVEESPRPRPRPRPRRSPSPVRASRRPRRRSSSVAPSS
ncbi:hypothetical protein QSU92_03235 [Microbacterium sp. ET2]|uniref:hypothetical protein n=1 Tax=Microbacterium albipurpureum TaxID=3050384 RepID=UPI00259C6A00|nr:hypothetical protein [Microbacterium sp. ET2 (Ac-2212)]WJL96228.1 hypothetical protein QSU92_03235 [Microbacterium sp. ET2 (Ac-2212)]